MIRTVVRPLRRGVPLLVALALVLLSTPARAADSVEGQLAGDWVATQFEPPLTYIAGPGGVPSPGSTLQGLLALAATGRQEATFEAGITWTMANVELAIAPDGEDLPGNLGLLLLLAAASGRDPGNWGGVDLEARLAATLGAHTPGLYGAGDPTYDGVFRQSLAVLGLATNGRTPDSAALDWLEAQQCDGTEPTAAGGFQPFRADPGTEACTAPDPVAFSGPDTNSTALALLALTRAGGWAGGAAASAWLQAAVVDDGVPFIPGGTADPNSTALALLALQAAGEDVSALRAALVADQFGCAAAVEDRGALTSPFSDGFPDQFASIQAAWALGVHGFAVDGPVAFTSADPCAPPRPVEPDAPIGGEGVAQPVVAPPTFTG